MSRSRSVVRKRAHAAGATVLAAVIFAACGGGSCGQAGNGGGNGTGGGGSSQPGHCQLGAFTPPDQSPYLMPYGIGTTHTMFQGNCPENPSWGHFGMFAYDFLMPLGTPLYAARDGTVIWANEQYLDGDHTPGHENNLLIQHSDGTVMRYGHLTLEGIVVEVGDFVRQGDLVAHSGNTGNSGGPHLHVDLLGDSMSWDKSNTLPLTFRNAGGLRKAASCCLTRSTRPSRTERSPTPAPSLMSDRRCRRGGSRMLPIIKRTCRGRGPGDGSR